MLVKDHFSRITTYDEVIDLGNNFELLMKRVGKSKSKITSDLDWFYAWVRYTTAVLWAYPHWQSELNHYGQHIIRQFMAGLDPHNNVEYDQAAVGRIMIRYRTCLLSPVQRAR